MEFKVYETTCDYITATTFEGSVYRMAVKGLSGVVEESPKEEKVQQYMGYRLGNMFYGEGVQGDKQHYLIQVSGSPADDAYQLLIDLGMDITRIDLQLTIEKPGWYKARSYVDSMRAGIWRGRVLNCEMYEDGKGNDTVYLGSKHSDKFTRVYVKAQMFLRYELQLRRKYAMDAARQIASGRKNAVRGILQSELAKKPSHPVNAEFRAFLRGAVVDVQAYRTNPDAVSRMRWLSTLLPTITRICNDHDYGQTAREWLKEIINETG